MIDSDENSDLEEDQIGLTPRFEDAEALQSRMFDTICRDLLSEDEQVRFNAINLIEYFECDPRLAQFILMLFEREDIQLTRAGVQALGAWRHSDGVPLLINFLTNANNANRLPELEEEIILSLGRIGGSDALEFLENYTLQRFADHKNDEDCLGMAGIEGIASIAAKGHDRAVQFLMRGCKQSSWNMRESCADSFGVLFSGKEKISKNVYDLLMQLTKDENKNVRIAAYLSLDAIVGLDEQNKKILAEARHKQIFGEK